MSNRILLTVGLAFSLLGCDYLATRGEIAIIREQLEDLKRGDIDKAYHLMPGTYRAMNTIDDYAAFVAAHPALKDNRSSSFPESHWSIDAGGVSLPNAVLTSNTGVKELFNYYVIHDSEGKWSVGIAPAAANP